MNGYMLMCDIYTGILDVM